MLTLGQNISAVIQTCFSQSKEELQEIATQRIVELIESSAPNTLEDDRNRWSLTDEVVPPDGDSDEILMYTEGETEDYV